MRGGRRRKRSEQPLMIVGALGVPSSGTMDPQQGHATTPPDIQSDPGTRETTHAHEGSR